MRIPIVRTQISLLFQHPVVIICLNEPYDDSYKWLVFLL